MNLQEYKAYLEIKKMEPKKIEEAIEIASMFKEFIERLYAEMQNTTYNQFYEFAKLMIEQEKNTYDNFVHLLRLAHYIKNKALIIAIMETVDGSEMIENFYSRLEAAHGTSIRDQVFDGIKIPPLGIHPKDRPALTMQLINRLEQIIGHKKASKFLNTGLRNRYTDWYDIARGTFQKAKDIDKYLEIIRTEFMQTLNEHNENKTLFFTQPIDNEVIAYVEENSRQIEAGIRDGAILTVAKIPYQTKQFLAAKRDGDRKGMQYYFCHNPWIREGICDESIEINPIACEISCGYYKDFWEGVLKEPVKVELVESLIRGGDTCSFVIHLPEAII